MFRNFKEIQQIQNIQRNKAPYINGIKTKTIIKGDEKILSISAASIIAKVTRDNFMKKLSKKFKGYSWNTNFGYGTKKHQEALEKLGVTPYHRKTYRPIFRLP